MKILSHILISALAVLLTAHLLPGVRVDNFGTAVSVALVLGIVNASLAPLLVLLTLTVNLPTLGLFTFFITGGLVLLTAKLVPGFHATSFWSALAFALLLSAISGIFHWGGAPKA